MTRADLEQAARDLYEEAIAADPIRIGENTTAVLGSPVFCWSTLTVTQLRALRRACYPTVLEARG